MEGRGERPAAGIEPGFLTRIGLVFAAPGRAFAAVGRRPGTWWQPLLLLALLNTLFVHLVYDRVLLPEQLEALEGRGLGAEEIAETAELIEGGVMRWASYGGTLVLTPGGAVLGAVVAYLLAAFLFGGGATFVQTLAVVGHALLIGLLESALRLPVMLLRGTTQVHFGPALFLEPADPPGFVFHLLAQADVFILWKVGLAGFGVAQVHGIRAGRMIGALLAVWALWALGAAGFSAALRL